ncbi:histidine phosphatase family protein [Mycobacterium sp. 852002-40037_SCH5390672]|uniref:histidine phosphatase family protein n=1 Tax=Mycobacterium sp. 852002-40037_SCH5390672 TaxID=1834089 RepID=UPI0008053A55|nr:histidine phosphatase family protein [Mycobacterium sp. 852002-40037_SCH5390672]OBB97362.1 histidine phosphatase [Mycobacterium sp. 852002-40037_SCH5390672]
MTEVVRLTLFSHGMTDALADGRFPTDEPLNALGRRQVEALGGLAGAALRQLAGPEQRTRQTAKLLGLQADTEPRLADLNCGRWRGEALAALPPEELDVWLTQPAAAPHGGESITDLVSRVSQWLESLTANPLRTVAVTHPAVSRAAIVAALDIAPASFWRIDVAPAGRIVMHFRAGRWTLRF